MNEIDEVDYLLSRGDLLLSFSLNCLLLLELLFDITRFVKSSFPSFRFKKKTKSYFKYFTFLVINLQFFLNSKLSNFDLKKY